MLKNYRRSSLGVIALLMVSSALAAVRQDISSIQSGMYELDPTATIKSNPPKDPVDDNTDPLMFCPSNLKLDRNNDSIVFYTNVKSYWSEQHDRQSKLDEEASIAQGTPVGVVKGYGSGFSDCEDEKLRNGKSKEDCIKQYINDMLDTEPAKFRRAYLESLEKFLEKKYEFNNINGDERVEKINGGEKRILTYFANMQDGTGSSLIERTTVLWNNTPGGKITEKVIKIDTGKKILSFRGKETGLKCVFKTSEKNPDDFKIRP